MHEANLELLQFNPDDIDQINFDEVKSIESA